MRKATETSRTPNGSGKKKDKKNQEYESIPFLSKAQITILSFFFSSVYRLSNMCGTIDLLVIGTKSRSSSAIYVYS